MSYESRALKRQKIRYNSDNDDNVLTYQLIKDGEKVTPASATITIYRSGNTTALLSAQAMTVSGSLMTYAVDTTTTASWPVQSDYRAEIIVTDGSAVTHDAHCIFDVVNFLLRLNIGKDQLIDRDAGVAQAEWDGDEDLSGLINACRDELQLLLETKSIQDEQLLEDMIIDSSRLAIPARLYILEAYWRGKDAELADTYEDKFNKLWKAFLNGIKYDTNQDGHEDASQGGIIIQRLVQ